MVTDGIPVTHGLIPLLTSAGSRASHPLDPARHIWIPRVRQVLIFEQPAGGDWRRAAWTKRRVATGWKCTLPLLPGRGAPGTARTFSPAGSSKPWILVSGDDAGVVDVLQPSRKPKRTRTVWDPNRLGCDPSMIRSEQDLNRVGSDHGGFQGWRDLK